VASDVVIFICTTCKREGEAADAPRAGALLFDAAVAAGGAHRVEPVKCLANCKRGLSAAVVRAGGWSYVFGGLAIEGAAEALQTGAVLLAGSPDGVMPWQGRPELLKRGMVARLPPIDLITAETSR
jgi:predicted metal-binding protein